MTDAPTTQLPSTGPSRLGRAHARDLRHRDRIPTGFDQSLMPIDEYGGWRRSCSRNLTTT